MTKAGADRLDERFVPGGAKLAWNEWRQTPVLPTRVEFVWRRADADPVSERVLERPPVGAIRIEANRQVLHHGKDGGGARQLTIELVLHPLVEADPIRRRLVPGRTANRGGIGMPQVRRPCVPASAESLGERAEHRVLPQHGTLL